MFNSIGHRKAHWGILALHEAMHYALVSSSINGFPVERG
ncbi:hypothetical protein R69658_04884 [Paraburkholderia aspalathi]|uniref:Uncharacterized protein n=1 Tax=Paraburkholderia aspalathi TaxID=1324617 RepID=A0ABN7MD24_9BURK|nr:hypothetical protein R69658_04884 [Paraburkholderia aspalathi]